MRSLEIQQWLENNEVESYIILDDENDMLPEQQSRFVKTSYYLHGLEDHHVEESIKLLKIN